MNERVTAAEAAEQLFHAYKHELYRHALFVLGNPTDAEDVVSEVFVRVCRTWNSFRFDSSPRTWVWTIARNILKDHLKKLRHARSLRDLDSVVDLSEPFDDPLERVECESLIRRLPPFARDVIHLRLVQELSVAQTAELLGCSQVKVRTVLFRARKALREIWKSEFVDVNGVESGGDKHAF